MGKRLTQIATRTGDDGTTGLGDNTRVSKGHLRVHAMGDVDEDRDWLMPFVTSMMIWQEDIMRQRLGLPSLLEDEQAALRHSTFFNFVKDGSPNPYFDWDRSWGTA